MTGESGCLNPLPFLGFDSVVKDRGAAGTAVYRPLRRSQESFGIGEGGWPSPEKCLVELIGVEPTTSALQGRRSPG